jgi:hypothetical protein
VPAPIT